MRRLSLGSHTQAHREDMSWHADRSCQDSPGQLSLGFGVTMGVSAGTFHFDSFVQSQSRTEERSIEACWCEGEIISSSGFLCLSGVLGDDNAPPRCTNRVQVCTRGTPRVTPFRHNLNVTSPGLILDLAILSIQPRGWRIMSAT